MANIDAEEAQFQQEISEVKKWWTDSRWRFTKRPFTAEQIVAKRGNLRISYPGNAQSKKLWNIMEGRFKVCRPFTCTRALLMASRTKTSATHTAASTLSWSHKWQSTLTLCTCLGGSVRRQLRRPTSLVQI
jgi:hypothetical protein